MHHAQPSELIGPLRYLPPCSIAERDVDGVVLTIS